MKIVNTFQQSFNSTATLTYNYTWILPRYMKSNLSNRFVVRISNVSIQTTSAAPNLPLLLYMYHPNFCAGANNEVFTTATSSYKNNKLLLGVYHTAVNNANARNNMVILCDDMPQTPIEINVEAGLTGGVPTAGNVIITVVLSIYEIEGDLDMSSIFV